jgi:hypothetical protein
LLATGHGQAGQLELQWCGYSHVSIRPTNGGASASLHSLSPCCGTQTGRGAGFRASPDRDGVSRLLLGQTVERAAVAGGEAARSGNPIQTRGLYANIRVAIQIRRLYVKRKGIIVNIWILLFAIQNSGLLVNVRGLYVIMRGRRRGVAGRGHAPCSLKVSVLAPRASCYLARCRKRHLAAWMVLCFPISTAQARCRGCEHQVLDALRTRTTTCSTCLSI